MNNLTLVDLFSVPICFGILKDDEKITVDEVNFLQTFKLQKQFGDDGNFLSDEIHVLKQKNLNRIKKVCDAYVKNYTQNIIGIEDDFRMFSSWISMNVMGTKHVKHSHRNTMISCIMYFDEFLSDEPMAPIDFHHDALDQVFKTFNFHFNVKSPNQYNTKVLTIQPKTNMFIIFPGWISHETHEAVSTTKRYCLGSNYFFTGKSSSGYHRINISIE
jgi:hypothetical protein